MLLSESNLHAFNVERVAKWKRKFEELQDSYAQDKVFGDRHLGNTVLNLGIKFQSLFYPKLLYSGTSHYKYIVLQAFHKMSKIFSEILTLYTRLISKIRAD